MSHYSPRRSRLPLTILGFVLLLVPLVLYAVPHFQRPPRISLPERSLFQGITYRQEARSMPRPLMIHVVTVDLNAPGVRVQVTPGNPMPDRTVTNARTTSEFLQEFGLRVAVNANFFYPFREKTPWDFYPHSGDRVSVVGEAIANGQVYSDARSDWPVLCFSTDNRAQISRSGRCPTSTAQAVSGSGILLEAGRIPEDLQSAADRDGLYSRTVVAIDQTGQKLWLIAVDDKQPIYSEGVTLEELAQLLLNLGADTAINLDGGGSTTLVIDSPTGPQVLNAPIHTKIPLRERPVANHLGFYAEPSSSPN